MDYREKRLQEFREKFFIENGNTPVEEYTDMEAFLSDTIEECHSFVPEKLDEIKYNQKEQGVITHARGVIQGFNKCVDAVEAKFGKEEDEKI